MGRARSRWDALFFFQIPSVFPRVIQGPFANQYPPLSPQVRKPHEPVRFSPEAAYLLVGCLGGLGRSLTTWMFERGCRHFVFLSRSGTAKPEAADVVRRLQEAGADVQVCCVDACDEEAVTGVVAQVASQRPIRGVVHAAMVLQVGASVPVPPPGVLSLHPLGTIYSKA